MGILTVRSWTPSSSGRIWPPWEVAWQQVGAIPWLWGPRLAATRFEIDILDRLWEPRFRCREVICGDLRYLYVYVWSNCWSRMTCILKGKIDWIAIISLKKELKAKLDSSHAVEIKVDLQSLNGCLDVQHVFFAHTHLWRFPKIDTPS